MASTLVAPSAPLDTSKDKALKAKKPKSAAPKSAKPAPAHPPYLRMIMDAIVALKERGGSSQYAIAKSMEEKYKAALPSNFKKLLTVQLRKLSKQGKLTKVKASFKLSDGLKTSAPKKVKVAKAVKSVSKKAAKLPKSPKKSAVRIPKSLKSSIVSTATTAVIASDPKTVSFAKSTKSKISTPKKGPKSVKSAAAAKSPKAKVAKSPKAKLAKSPKAKATKAPTAKVPKATKVTK